MALVSLFRLMHLLHVLGFDFIAQVAEHFVQLAQNNFLHCFEKKRYREQTNLTRVKWDDWLMTETLFQLGRWTWGGPAVFLTAPAGIGLSLSEKKEEER